jgi:AraC family transcriptional activator of pobA
MQTSPQPRPDFVPSFQLYGQPKGQGLPDMIHVEPLQDRSEPHGWEIKPHRHFGLLQLMHFKTPGVRVGLDGRTFRTERPSILLVPPAIVHGFAFTPDVDGTVTTLPTDLLREAGGRLPASLRQPGLITDHDRMFEQCSHLIAAIHREFHGREPQRERAIRALVDCLVVFIDRHIRTAEGPISHSASPDRMACGTAERRINAFLDLVEAQFTGTWGPGDYAAEIGISKGQLTRDCRALLGRSPLQVIHDRIIKEANRKLAYTVWPVGQISDALGFSDIGYFSRFYRQRAGQTPTAYRARIQSRMAPEPRP